MNLRSRHRYDLLRIQQTLRASDPHLCSMLVIFSRLAAGEAMPARERMPRSLPRAVRLLTGIVLAAARPCGRILLAFGRVVLRTVLRGLARCRFLPAGLRLAANGWAAQHRRTPSAGPPNRKVT
jgi:hypothetical protein